MMQPSGQGIVDLLQRLCALDRHRCPGPRSACWLAYNERRALLFEIIRAELDGLHLSGAAVSYREVCPRPS